MLPNNHLQQFAQQLATWAEQIIENGRTPFRRVDLFHQLHTSAGICHPPLIFWINRQSMIAGGLIFLPDNTTDHGFSKEAAAATSLGLRHFVTWETEKINIWEVATESNLLVTSLPLAETQDPAVFHHRLYELIDQLKLLSVTGRINAQEISAYYLLNLLEETLALSLPALLEYCRIKQSENSSVLTAEEEAQSWNRLALLRLLSLLNWKLLPTNLPMEQLTASEEELLSTLPEPLGQTLQILTPGASQHLPAESAVAFHHLLLRLQQIDWQGQDKRGEQTIRLLLNLWHGESAGKAQANSKDRLLLHSQELAPDCCREVSHSAAQLAANCLMRVLDSKAHPAQLQGDAFKISSAFAEKFLHANFYGSQRPDPALRRELAGHLRNSWPNRRLNIPGNLPFWATEAAHLLGLTTQDSQIELHLPANWLHLPGNSFFTELIFTNFVLESIDCSEEKWHLLKLYRRQGECTTECLLLDNSRRAIELGLDHKQAANKLIYALELPLPIFELLAEGQLVLLAETSEETSDLQALACYGQSNMGQQLWQLRTRTPIPESSERLRAEGITLNWLVPQDSCLKELKQLVADQKIASGEAQPDELLNQLLGLPTDLPGIQIRTAKDKVGPKQINRNLSDELLRLLEIEGIPHFPQTYLYRQATGPLCTYNFTPPLMLRQELLGQYELEDAKGQQLQVTGEETKEALLLASILGLSNLEIPLDRQQTAEMLDSYRQDLHKLQETMARLCHLHIDQSNAAHRQQKKLWQQLPLPPLKWLSS
jgi:hypothetical protein